ncbi:MAG: hypothetical protein GPJ54_03520 [Candidatus Heimdallarchaeota archaeon]|nr:hypothetical protein [Candidatus Heimdallarchaeota archaeon]
MTEITEKFCEECGKTSPIEVKFCKFCGIEFPVIDHPGYVQANSPAPKPPIEGQFPNQQSQTGQPNIPPQYPPQYAPQQEHPQGFPHPQNQEHFMRKPPRAWQGGGLVGASFGFYSNPIETTQSLIEDPQAPNSVWIILLTALSAALVQYFTYLKTNFTELIGENDSFFDTYASSEGVQNSAMQGAVAMFILLFISWYIISWLLALTIKNGLPPESYLLHSPSKSMRRLTGFLYIPTLFRNIAEIILLQFEDKRDASLKEGELFNNSAPEITYLTNFSNEFFLILFIVALIMAVITAMTLYRSIKFGLNHRGSSPAMIAFLIVLNSVLFYIP